MRKSTLFLIGTTTAILTATLFGKRTEQPADNFVWIDGDDPVGDADQPKPMFYVGDHVLIYNPYTGEFYREDWIVSPIKYEIIESRYDDEQSVYRYRLKNGDPNDWYSEDWLSLPVHTDFIREWHPSPKRDEPTTEMVKAERNILSKAMDDMARQTQIDKCLDTLAHGSSEERAEAERVLTELTKEGNDVKAKTSLRDT